MKSKITKVATLTLFSVMIVSFVAYKAGCFDGLRSQLFKSQIGSTHTNQQDTVHKKDSLRNPKIMSSSKVMILKEHKLLKVDTIKSGNDSLFNMHDIDPLIYSSKSSIIISPNDLGRAKLDSIKLDTLNTKWLK